MNLAFNDFGDLLAVDAERPLVVLPRLWDFDSVEVRDDAAVVSSGSLGEVVLVFDSPRHRRWVLKDIEET